MSEVGRAQALPSVVSREGANARGVVGVARDIALAGGDAWVVSGADAHGCVPSCGQRLRPPNLAPLPRGGF